MLLQQFYDVLLSVNKEKKSGKVYVYVKDVFSKRNGIILVDQGEISSISYSNSTSMFALEKMLSLEVKEIIFMPFPSGDSNKDPDAPSILSVLDILKSFSNIAAPNAIDPHEIRKGAEALLKIIYGPGITKEIDKIAKAYPIEQDPGKFLDQCKTKAMLMLSKDQVETLFRPLYAKISR